MSVRGQFELVGLRIFEETKAGLKDDWEYISEKGAAAIGKITLLLGEAAVRGQMGEDVTILKNACAAALGNWESVSFVKAADRADEIRASIMKALREALEIVLMIGLKAVIPI